MYEYDWTNLLNMIDKFSDKYDKLTFNWHLPHLELISLAKSRFQALIAAQTAQPATNLRGKDGKATRTQIWG